MGSIYMTKKFICTEPTELFGCLEVAKDQVIGGLLVVISIIVIVVYGWLVFLPPNIKLLGVPIDLFMLKLTGFIAVLGVFGILSWIGYTLATTPPPKPIEEIEKELEEELKKLETEMKGAEETKQGGEK